MKQLITALALTIAAAGVFAADPTPPPAKHADGAAAEDGRLLGRQQGQEGRRLQGGAEGLPVRHRRAAAAASTPMTQQQKMAACSKQNKGKKGDDYKSAQKACLAA